MDHMDSSTTTTTTSHMAMTFYTSTSTPLFSTLWTPSSTGPYAGTCIFLIVLAVLFRALLALKAWREAAWLDAAFQRRYVAVQGKGSLAQRMRASEDSEKRMVLSENGVEEEVVVVKRRGGETRAWRWGVDPVRAGLDTVIAGVGYLLFVLPSWCVWSGC
jgi:hypothetical protein